MERDQNGAPLRCYKRSYAHRRNARKVASQVKGPMWVYRCDNCGSYHLTAKEPYKLPPKEEIIPVPPQALLSNGRGPKVVGVAIQASPSKKPQRSF